MDLGIGCRWGRVAWTSEKDHRGRRGPATPPRLFGRRFGAADRVRTPRADHDQGRRPGRAGRRRTAGPAFRCWRIPGSLGHGRMSISRTRAGGHRPACVASGPPLFQPERAMHDTQRWLDGATGRTWRPVSPGQPLTVRRQQSRPAGPEDGQGRAASTRGTGVPAPRQHRWPTINPRHGPPGRRSGHARPPPRPRCGARCRRRSRSAPRTACGPPPPR